MLGRDVPVSPSNNEPGSRRAGDRLDQHHDDREQEGVALPTRKAPSRFRDILVIVGKTGTGKTRWSIAEVQKRHRVIVVDPNQDDPYPGLVLDSASDILDHVEEFPAFRIVTPAIDELESIAEIVFTIGRTTLVLDEAQSYLSPAVNLKGEFPSIRNIIFRGRHNLSSLFTVAQRATSIHVDARSQWTRIIAFHQSEPDDVKWLEQQAGQRLDFSRLPDASYYDISRHEGVRIRSLDTGEQS